MRTIVATLCLVAAACGEPPSPEVPVMRDPMIVSAESGAVLDFDALVDVLEQARVVYLGERHDEGADHRAQAAITHALWARDPSLGIGFEMFQRPSQPALDEYVSGAIDEGALLERVDWERRWGFDFDMYRPLVRMGREHRIPLVALNAPSELTRAVARHGIEGLDQDLRAELPELDLAVAAHRARFDEAMREHPGMDDERRARFYEAQVVWDETMATHAAAFLAAEEAPRRMVVVAGTMHVHRDAIPARAARRGAAPYVIVQPVGESDLDEARADGAASADFFWVVPD